MTKTEMISTVNLVRNDEVAKKDKKSVKVVIEKEMATTVMIRNVPVAEDLSRKNVGNENGETQKNASGRKTAKRTEPERTKSLLKSLLKMTKRRDVPKTRQT